MIICYRSRVALELADYLLVQERVLASLGVWPRSFPSSQFEKRYSEQQTRFPFPHMGAVHGGRLTTCPNRLGGSVLRHCLSSICNHPEPVHKTR